MAQMRSVVTLSNSIIGVSILAMPFCFKQCGIVLALVMLYLSGLLVKATSYFLLKSAIMARRRNYETLAFNVFGAAGKMAIEVSMIGFLGGTCIAFFVVMGDLAPPIIAGYLGIENTERLRIGVLLGVGLVVVLPLSLLRNIDSLVALCTASILFYSLVMLYIMFTSLESLVAGNWWVEATKWRPAGIFQCLPIFTMALSCQAQLFEVYDTIPDPSLGQMVEIVKGAVNLCSGIYICVGFFGYIAFYSVDFGGNILTAFPDSFGVELTKMGFALSVAVSFPMVIFPCRTAINSILFARKGGGSSTDIAKNYIPHERFVFITTCVVLATLFTAIQIPDIELVLGITGSTIGTVICILFPVSMFIKLVNVNTTEKLVAQAIFIIGVIVLVLGTYVTLYEADSKHVESPVPKLDPGFVAPQPVAINKLDVINPQIALPKLSDVKNNLDSATKAPDNVVKGEVNLLKEKPKEIVEVRQEPIQPLPPKEDVDKNEDSVPNLVTEKSIQSSSNVTVEKVEEESIKQKEKVLEIKEKQANKLIKQLKEQKQEHAQIIKQQKEVLEQLKDHVDAEKAQDSNVDGGQQVNLGPNAVQSNQEQVIRQDVFPAQQQVPVQQIIHNDAQGPIKTNQIITNANNGIKQNMENQNNNMQPHQIFPQQPIQNNPQQNAIQQQPIAPNQQMFQPSPNQHQPVVQNQPVLQQASNGQQQLNVKNYQAVQNDANIQQQQQIFQNRPSNNIQASQFQMSNQNPAPQQPIIQGDAYQNEAQLQGKINQKRQILQPKLNGENPIPQQQINNQVLGNQLSQAQNQLEQQISQGQFQQQNIQGQNIQVPLQKQQQPVPINNQVPQFLNQNAVGIPALQQQWVEGQNQLSNQTQLNMQQNIENNLGMQQANINSDNFAQQNQYQQQRDISNLNIKPRSKDGGNEGYISSNLKPVIENRGKVDVKRETKKIQRNFEGKIKLPGRDLKEVNANFLGNNYAEESEISKVVKRDTVPEQLLDVQDTRMAQSLKIENLNKLAIVGASMGIVKTRHLLSEDSKERYS